MIYFDYKPLISHHGECAAIVPQICCKFAANIECFSLFYIPSWWATSSELPCKFVSIKTKWNSFRSNFMRHRAFLEKRLKFQKIAENQIMDWFSFHCTTGKWCASMFLGFLCRFKNILDVYEDEKNIDVHAMVWKEKKFKVSGKNRGQMFLPAS